MKKLFIMALAAIFAANISAHEGRSHRSDDQKDKKEVKELIADEETEREIKFFCNELYLDKKQAANFAKTYRAYKADINKVKGKYQKKFAKDLNDRQVEKVLRSSCSPHHSKGKCRR